MRIAARNFFQPLRYSSSAVWTNSLPHRMSAILELEIVCLDPSLMPSHKSACFLKSKTPCATSGCNRLADTDQSTEKEWGTRFPTSRLMLPTETTEIRGGAHSAP